MRNSPSSRSALLKESAVTFGPPHNHEVVKEAQIPVCKCFGPVTFDVVLVLLSTSLSLVILTLRHQTGFGGGVKYGGRIGQEIEKT